LTCGCRDLVARNRSVYPLVAMSCCSIRDNGVVQIGPHRKFHSIPNDACQIVGGLLRSETGFKHLEHLRSVHVVFVRGLLDAPHADRVPSPVQDNLDHSKAGIVAHHAILRSMPNDGKRASVAALALCAQDVREMLRVPRVWTKEHRAPFDQLVAAVIRGALDRHLTAEVFWSKVEVIAALAEVLKLPHQHVAAFRVEP
jgi:hypothetical protein